jgi:uncharacterized protein YecT (DUF1311 family)
MTKIVPALLLSMGLLCAAAAPAQEKPAEKHPCEDAKTQYDLNICYDKQFKAADAELNRVYNRLASKLGAAERAKLKTSEVSWLKYRDDNCDYEAFLYEGGTIQPSIYSSCLERVTRARTAELREVLDLMAQ